MQPPYRLWSDINAQIKLLCIYSACVICMPTLNFLHLLSGCNAEHPLYSNSIVLLPPLAIILRSFTFERALLLYDIGNNNTRLYAIMIIIEIINNQISKCQNKYYNNYNCVRKGVPQNFNTIWWCTGYWQIYTHYAFTQGIEYWVLISFSEKIYYLFILSQIYENMTA